MNPQTFRRVEVALTYRLYLSTGNIQYYNIHRDFYTGVILLRKPSSWNCMQAHGSFWNILEHSGTFWNILHRFWKILHTFWNILHTFWNILEHSGTFCMHSGTFWMHFVTFWNILHVFWNVLEHYGIICIYLCYISGCFSSLAGWETLWHCKCVAICLIICDHK